MTPRPTGRRTLLEEIEQRKREHAQQQTNGHEAHANGPRRAIHNKKWYFEPQSREQSDGWLLTYLDTITLLLVLLLVMLTMAGKGDDNQQGQGVLPAQTGLLNQQASALPNGVALRIPFPPVPESTEQTPDLTQGLNLDNLGDNVEVVMNDKSVSFRINSEILFGSGEAQLSLGGLEVLQRLAHTLKDSPHTVTIEGHTDAIPIRSARFPSNWELSSARAGSVVRYLEANGIASRRLRAVGYADTRPLAQNNTTANRALNRRVELMLEMPATQNGHAH
ncbi:MAG: flagellar motor protein [Pusillimonas sp.]|nr:flagellar motor protein [Pusillimonas sp.]|tara:strand:+ start:1416 stop:2249 length:834 start_codon:yes stop_codon:yes gene_type:complete